MALTNISFLNKQHLLKHIVSSTNESINNTISKAIKFISELIPPVQIDLKETKEEIWKDLSALYFKYEGSYHKKAFREITHDISEKMKEGRWDKVYKKLYYLEQKSN